MGVDQVAAALMLPAVLALLWVKRHEQVRRELVVKPIASGLFLVVGVAQTAPDPTFGAWVLAGLTFSLLGDVFLIGKGRRWVAPGLVAFLLAHGCYLVAVVPRAEAGWAIAVAVGLTLVGGLALRPAWGELGRLRSAAVVYLGVLSGLTGAAVSVWIAAPRSVGGALLGVGMLLFYASDLSVLRYRFVEARFGTKVWGTPAYYAAQLLLAFSIGAVGGLAGGP